MTDKLTEALAWWDEDNPDKPWYMDPARELWERRGKQDEWGRITTDAIYILLHVRPRLAPVEEAARRWASFPTDGDVGAAVLWVSRIHHGHAASVPCIVCVEAARAALEAVKREDR